MKVLPLTLAGVLLAVGFAACDATRVIDDVIGDAATEPGPACAAIAATTADSACLQYREVLCSRHIDCGTYVSTARCVAWFDGQYGACEDAQTIALSALAQASLKTCLCRLPDAVCASLVAEGAEATVPGCGEF